MEAFLGTLVGMVGMGLEALFVYYVVLPEARAEAALWAGKVAAAYADGFKAGAAALKAHVEAQVAQVDADAHAAKLGDPVDVANDLIAGKDRP